MDLSGQTAIVTRSASGIGRELAREFARAGANVVCCGRRAPKLSESVALIEAEGGLAIAIPVDVTDSAQVQGMVQQTLDWFGRIDLLFSNFLGYRL